MLVVYLSDLDETTWVDFVLGCLLTRIDGRSFRTTCAGVGDADTGRTTVVVLGAVDGGWKRVGTDRGGDIAVAATGVIE